MSTLRLVKILNETGSEWKETTDEEQKNFILSQLATKYSEDLEFLRKVNKLTFGLQSK